MHLDGEIKLRLRDCYLNYEILPKRPEKEIDIKLVALTRQEQGSYKPPINHPWGQSYLNRKMKQTANIQV